MKKCLIEGCEADTRSRFSGKEGRICDAHWRKLPITVRVRYWDITDWGKLEPPPELIQELNQLIFGAQHATGP